jgi:hypothetical protein
MGKHLPFLKWQNYINNIENRGLVEDGGKGNIWGSNSEVVWLTVRIEIQKKNAQVKVVVQHFIDKEQKV